MAFDFRSKFGSLFDSQGSQFGSKLSSLADRLGFRNPRPPFEGAYIYILLFFIGMLGADFATTYLRSYMLPIGGITRAQIQRNNGLRSNQNASIFSSVKDRNIFNSDHFIPDAMGEKGETEGEDNSKPVLSSLPLQLVGTIIHGNPNMSVATIQVSGKDIEAVMVDEEIEGMAKIRQIERFKVTFRNLRNRKMEYIEIKEENKIRLGMARPSKGPVQPVQPAEQTNFTFQRAEIDRYLENLPKILQDAKAIAYKAPGSNEISGFKLVAIKAGSVYEKLGLKRGDIIKNVNGEPVDTPQKAMELYQALKSANNIQLEVTRGGSPTTLNYQLE